MSILDLLVLPADVSIIAAASAPKYIREQFKRDSGEFIVTRAGIRANSYLLDSSAVQLLEEFRTPKTVVEATINYGADKNLDPRELLSEIALLVQNFLDHRLLAIAGSSDSREITQTLSIGENVDGFRIIHCLNVLEDTEIYKAENANGLPAAIKIAGIRSSIETRKNFEREAEILDYLNGTVSPKLLATGRFDNRFYFVTEWCEGVPAAMVAATYGGKRRYRNSLKQICINILESYVILHRMNIVHGDIHPRNIIVDENGKIKLIDFANSNAVSVLPELPDAERAGMAYFYEPEYAESFFSRIPPPAATFSGEQYALAALIYFLLTGHHYIDFSLEHNTQLKQIIQTASPIPFFRRGIKPLPATEAILAKALSKKSERRFSSIEEFKKAFEESFEEDENVQKINSDGSDSAASGSATSGSHIVKRKSVLDNMLSRFNFNGDLFRNGLNADPLCSIYYGAAGIAYALYRIACIKDDAKILSLADAWAMKAYSQRKSSGAFSNADLQITKRRIGNISPYHTISGIYCVQAYIFNALGAQELCDFAIGEFISASSVSCKNLNLTLGISGSLLASALLLELSPQNPKLLEFGNKIAEEINREMNNFTPGRTPIRSELLGMAHGRAGIFYALMNWHYISNRILPPEFLDRFTAYTKQPGFGSTEKKQSNRKTVNRNIDYPISWCSGDAGYVFLYTSAYRILKEDKYLLMAERLAERICKNSQAASGSLCCGATGQAYALLNIYKYTSEPKWLKLSYKLHNHAVQIEIHKNIHFHSLYKGLLGTALLEADLMKPSQSVMPLFEITGYDG